MATRSATHDDWTVAQLHALPDDGNRYEIIDGALYVTPAPRYVHQWALQVLSEHLLPFARANALDVMCLAADIQYSDRTLVQPDLFVFPRVPGKRITEWADVQPLRLVVEALSPSTRRRDRTVKRKLYLSEGIPEYWMLNIEARTIERWRLESAEAEIVSTTLDWHPVPSRAPLRIDVVEFFRTVHGD